MVALVIFARGIRTRRSAWINRFTTKESSGYPPEGTEDESRPESPEYYTGIDRTALTAILSLRRTGALRI